MYCTTLSRCLYMSTFVAYSGEAVDALGKKVIADIKASSGKERKFNALLAKWKYRQKTKLCRVKYQVEMDSCSSKIRPILVYSMSSYDIWLVTTVVMYDCNTGRKYAMYVLNADRELFTRNLPIIASL